MASILIVTSKAKDVAKQHEVSLGSEALLELSSYAERVIQRAALKVKEEGRTIIKAHHVKEALQGA